MVASKSSPTILPSTQSIYINGKKYPLSEQVVKNIETIIGFQAKQEQKLPKKKSLQCLLHGLSAYK